MKWLGAIFKELYGLFVDDAGQAILVLLWLAMMWFVVSHFAGLPAWATALLFFAGPAAILCESVLRFARVHRRS